MDVSGIRQQKINWSTFQITPTVYLSLRWKIKFVKPNQEKKISNALNFGTQQNLLSNVTFLLYDGYKISKKQEENNWANLFEDVW